MSATASSMEQLHELLCAEFHTILKDGVEVMVEGEVRNIRPTPAALAVIRQFLKDNNVELVKDSDDKVIKDILKRMPQFGDTAIAN